MILIVLNDLFIPDHQPTLVALICKLKSIGFTCKILVNPESIELQNWYTEKDVVFDPPHIASVLKKLHSTVKEEISKLKNDFPELTDIPILTTEHGIGSEEIYTLCDGIGKLSASEIDTYVYQSIGLGYHTYIDRSLTLKSSLASVESYNVSEFTKCTILCSLLVIKSFQHILEEDGISQVIQSNVYSANISLAEYAKSQCVQSRFIEIDGIDRSYVDFYTNEVSKNHWRRTLMSDTLHNHAQASSFYGYALRYIDARICSNSIFSYSPLYSEHMDIPVELQSIIADEDYGTYFCNSPDEDIAIEVQEKVLTTEASYYPGLPFKDEISCLESVLKTTLSNKKHLCVRLHPRLGRDRRNPRISSGLKRIMDILDRYKSKNITVILPEAPVSSYWLALKSSYVVSFRGTMPSECSLFGVKPLVGCSMHGMLNSSLHTISKISYSDALHFTRKLTTLQNARTISLSVDETYMYLEFIRDFYYHKRLGKINLGGSAKTRFCMPGVLAEHNHKTFGDNERLLKAALHEGSTLSPISLRTRDIREELTLLAKYIFKLQATVLPAMGITEGSQAAKRLKAHFDNILSIFRGSHEK